MKKLLLPIIFFSGQFAQGEIFFDYPDPLLNIPINFQSQAHPTAPKYASAKPDMLPAQSMNPWTPDVLSTSIEPLEIPTWKHPIDEPIQVRPFEEFNIDLPENHKVYVRNHELIEQRDDVFIPLKEGQTELVLVGNDGLKFVPVSIGDETTTALSEEAFGAVKNTPAILHEIAPQTKAIELSYMQQNHSMSYMNLAIRAYDFKSRKDPSRVYLEEFEVEIVGINKKLPSTNGDLLIPSVTIGDHLLIRIQDKNNLYQPALVEVSADEDRPLIEIPLMRSYDFDYFQSQYAANEKQLHTMCFMLPEIKSELYAWVNDEPVEFFDQFNNLSPDADSQFFCSFEAQKGLNLLKVQLDGKLHVLPFMTQSQYQVFPLDLNPNPGIQVTTTLLPTPFELISLSALPSQPRPAEYNELWFFKTQQSLMEDQALAFSEVSPISISPKTILESNAGDYQPALYFVNPIRERNLVGIPTLPLLMNGFITDLVDILLDQRAFEEIPVEHQGSLILGRQDFDNSESVYIADHLGVRILPQWQTDHAGVQHQFYFGLPEGLYSVILEKDFAQPEFETVMVVDERTSILSVGSSTRHICSDC